MSSLIFGLGGTLSFHFPSVGVYWWDFVQHVALLCSPSRKVEVLFTVSDYPQSIKEVSWFICIGAYRCHRTRVRSIIEGCAEYRLTLPQLPYLPNLATYDFSSALNNPLFHPPIVSNRNIYITGTAVSVIYIFNVAVWRIKGDIGGCRFWYDFFLFDLVGVIFIMHITQSLLSVCQFTCPASVIILT